MKKNRLLVLCALFIAGFLSLTACGRNNGNMNNGTEAPSNDLKDAGKNLMDSIEDTGDAIRDGVNNLGNGTNKTNP